MLTPMRKLIMKMPDMAMVVCNQCIKANEKKPEDDDYEVRIPVVKFLWVPFQLDLLYDCR